jgi:hypothetical protein
MTQHIKLINAALDKFRAPGQQETLVLRGVIAPECLRHIQADDYQREVLSQAKINKLKEALVTSSVPDIELGMRGANYSRGADHGVFYLRDAVFVIDGLQRKTAGVQLMEADGTVKPRIGALVHLNTNKDWERNRFRILNQERSRLSANVLLRNLRPDSVGVDMLYRLCTEDKAFALHDRVQWAQNMTRGQLIPALLLCRSVTILHSRFCVGGRDYDPNGLSVALDKMVGIVGKNTMRDNIRQFYELVDECFGIRRVAFRDSAVQLRSTFLTVLADLFTRFNVFWKEHRLVVERDLRRKIGQFPLHDPEVSRLAGAGGQARVILYTMLLDHVNSGKRTKRLRPDEAVEPAAEEAEEAA